MAAISWAGTLVRGPIRILSHDASGLTPFELAAEMARVVPAARGHHFLDGEKRCQEQIARVIERELTLHARGRAAELFAEQVPEVRRRQIDGGCELGDTERPRAMAFHQRQRQDL